MNDVKTLGNKEDFLNLRVQIMQVNLPFLLCKRERQGEIGERKGEREEERGRERDREG